VKNAAKLATVPKNARRLRRDMGWFIGSISLRKVNAPCLLLMRNLVLTWRL
jgi:hypothetical protein